MSEPAVVETPAGPVAKAAPPKKKASKTKSKNTKSSHPKISMMVNSAIVDLKERGGSSLQAIKKYISSTYDIDAEKLAPFIRKHLKASVVNGSLIQTKGKGATGSFKVGVGKKESVAPKATKKIVAKPVKARAPKTKRVSVRKTKPVKVKAAKPKKVTRVKAKKSPAKAPKPKKSMKAKAGKTKAPKQKK